LTTYHGVRFAGYSFLSNQYGLSVDNMAGFELVLPNGTITHVTSENEDLWFALRVSAWMLFSNKRHVHELALLGRRKQLCATLGCNMKRRGLDRMTGHCNQVYLQDAPARSSMGQYLCISGFHFFARLTFSSWVGRRAKLYGGPARCIERRYDKIPGEERQKSCIGTWHTPQLNRRRL
jgi:hypothetical protein